MKRIVLCADDYGQALPISQGILSLLTMNRLSAVSCMVNTPFWMDDAKKLIPFKQQADIGLHINLTEGAALSPAFIQSYGPTLFPLQTIMQQSLLQQLSREIITAECAAQIQRFIDATGCAPDFLDGHQHVHQFPVIRRALIDAYQQLCFEKKIYIRLINEKINYFNIFKNVKNIIIKLMGTRELKKLLDQYHIPYNSSFAGIYSFTQSKNYRSFFLRFLRASGDNGLIMCHPGFASTPSDPSADPIADARYMELQYFSSVQFIDDLAQEKVILSRFSTP